jgi:hypothetical protein
MDLKNPKIHVPKLNLDVLETAMTAANSTFPSAKSKHTVKRSECIEDQIDRLNSVLQSVMDNMNSEYDEPSEFKESMSDFQEKMNVIQHTPQGSEDFRFVHEDIFSDALYDDDAFFTREATQLMILEDYRSHEVRKAEANQEMALEAALNKHFAGITVNIGGVNVAVGSNVDVRDTPVYRELQALF